MEIPTLVISDPPHGEVDLEAAGELLGLDPFATRLKANFAAPEVMSASGAEEAAEFAAALQRTGFTVSVLYGAALAGLPWPDPVSSLALDVSCLRATIRNDGFEVPYDADAVGVYSRPPADLSMKPTVDVGRALATGHGPTIADAIQWVSNLDLYFRDAGSLRRISIVPHLLELDGEHLVAELGRRFTGLRLDARLAGVRPRGRFVVGETRFEGHQRRRYSFGTPGLRHVLESISPELRSVSQYELGSRLAYALSPLEAPGDPS